jgi:hypothetical protein
LPEHDSDSYPPLSVYSRCIAVLILVFSSEVPSCCSGRHSR